MTRASKYGEPAQRLLLLYKRPSQGPFPPHYKTATDRLIRDLDGFVAAQGSVPDLEARMHSWAVESMLRSAARVTSYYILCSMLLPRLQDVVWESLRGLGGRLGPGHVHREREERVRST